MTRSKTVKIKDQLPKVFVLGFFGLGAAILISKNYQSTSAGDTAVARVNVTQAALSQTASEGEALFAANCATCHGEKASGTDKGPPLVHDVYNPGHHPDESFYSAAANGVPQHHWPYGNMPPQSQLEKEEVAKIVRYVRELQVANGITYKPHRM
ncbi:MAG: cytochrome c [Notoacmeibacter sp.]|nr:cytochrome c [Notoacmeibacter sp.]